MALIDRIFKARKEKQLQTTDFMFRPNQGLVMKHDQDRIFEIFKNCGIDYAPEDARSIMKLSRSAYDIFPFVRRAIKDFASMVGNVEIVAKEGQTISETLLDQMNVAAKQLPILNEFDWERPHDRGVNSLVYRIIRTALRDGMAFAEDRYEEESLEYLGALIFDSGHFEYVRESMDPYRLKYRADQYPDLESGLFHQFGYEFSNERPWANPLLAGAGFYMHVLTSLLVAVRNINTRKGAPVELGLITPGDDSALQDKARKDSYTKAISELYEGMKKALKGQMNGKSTSIVAPVPMNVNLITKAFGVEGLNEVDHDILGLVLMGFANLLEIPYEFIGQVLGSSGFSPERFKILFKIWGTKVDNLRESAKPVIMDVTRNYFRSLGINPVAIENMDLVFNTPDVLDEMEMQEIRKMKADADSQFTNVANVLAQIDTNEARTYLEENGIIQGRQ